MLTAERLWVMSLDERGGPRVRSARVAVTAGLMLDLEAAGLLTWAEDDIALTTVATSDPLLRWARTRLMADTLPAEGRFVLGTLYPGAWERIGEALVESGLAERRHRRLRRREFFRLRSANTRISVVAEARTHLFDTEHPHSDPCLDVLAACSIGEELLSGTAFTDDRVAALFADRPTTPIEEKVWLAVRWAASQSVFSGTSMGVSQTPL